METTASGSIRTVVSPDGWKLNVSPGGFGSELFHLAEDPLERVNRLCDPGTRPVVRRILRELHAWQERTGDAVKLPAGAGERVAASPGR